MVCVFSSCSSSGAIHNILSQILLCCFADVEPSTEGSYLYATHTHVDLKQAGTRKLDDTDSHYLHCQLQIVTYQEHCQGWNSSCVLPSASTERNPMLPMTFNNPEGVQVEWRHPMPRNQVGQVFR